MDISLFEFSQKADPYVCTNYDSFQEPADEFLVSSNDHLDIVTKKARKLAMVVLENKSVAAALGEADTIAEEVVMASCTDSQKRMYRLWKNGAQMPQMKWTSSAKTVENNEMNQNKDHAKVSEEHLRKRLRMTKTDEDEHPNTLIWALAELYRISSAARRSVSREDVQFFCTEFDSLRPLLDTMHKIIRFRTGSDGAQVDLLQRRRAREQEATRRAVEAIEQQYATIKMEAQKHFDQLEQYMDIIRERIQATEKEGKNLGQIRVGPVEEPNMSVSPTFERGLIPADKAVVNASQKSALTDISDDEPRRGVNAQPQTVPACTVLSKEDQIGAQGAVCENKVMEDEQGPVNELYSMVQNLREDDFGEFFFSSPGNDKEDALASSGVDGNAQEGLGPHNLSVSPNKCTSPLLQSVPGERDAQKVNNGDQQTDASEKEPPRDHVLTLSQEPERVSSNNSSTTSSSAVDRGIFQTRRLGLNRPFHGAPRKLATASGSMVPPALPGPRNPHQRVLFPGSERTEQHNPTAGTSSNSFPIFAKQSHSPMTGNQHADQRAHQLALTNNKAGDEGNSSTFRSYNLSTLYK